jgi:hypothetical protein
MVEPAKSLQHYLRYYGLPCLVTELDRDGGVLDLSATINGLEVAYCFPRYDKQEESVEVRMKYGRWVRLW